MCQHLTLIARTSFAITAKIMPKELTAVMTWEFYFDHIHKQNRPSDKDYNWIALADEMVDYCEPYGIGNTAQQAIDNLSNNIEKYRAERAEYLKK